MKRLRHFVTLFMASAILLGSCSRGPRMIPESKFVKIYADLLVADAWLSDHSELREKADTTLFYEAVFSKYGCTRDDFLFTVSERLKDMESFVETMDKVANRIDRESKARMDDIRESVSLHPAGEALDEDAIEEAEQERDERMKKSKRKTPDDEGVVITSID